MVPQRPREGEAECEDQVTLVSLLSLPRPHGDLMHLVGGKAPDLQGTGLTWASCLLTGWGHLSGTPVHRAASSATIKKPWMSNLDATRSPRVLEPRQSTWVLGDTGCFTNVGCVPNPRATPFIPRTEVHYSTQDNSSSASDTETAFQIIFCANSDDSVQSLEAGS